MTAIEPVRFGVIGVGRIAQGRFAPAIANARNATLVAAASRDESRAAALGCRAYSRYADLINDPEIEAIYIATHNGRHKDLSIAALQAGVEPAGDHAESAAAVIENPVKAEVDVVFGMERGARPHRPRRVAKEYAAPVHAVAPDVEQGAAAPFGVEPHII